jgi:peptidoglycan/xylan/chitin deacetylase (PgdA/CDA1 family)
MKIKLLLLCLLAVTMTALAVGCRKAPWAKVDASPESETASAEAAASPSPAPEATPEPTPVAEATPEPTPEFQLDTSSQVVVYCYHRFEGDGYGVLSIKPETFRTQLQALKDAGIEVISMKDFLAWKAGEKNIPARSALITIDDGYESGYSVAWPILQEFGYPFTMYIYTDFVGSGGKSISWEQLAEMRDDGVDIGNHSKSHSNLRAEKGKSPEAYKDWLREELVTSKDIIEQKLGIRVLSHAYPYGNYNDTVREIVSEAGYDAAFTVYGKHLGHSGDTDILGRYAIEEKKPQVFEASLKFRAPSPSSGGGSSAPAPMAQLAGSSMITEPADGSTVGDPNPTLKVNLATLGDIDPGTVTMRVSGFGVVPAVFDPETKLLSYKMRQNLRPKSYTVIVQATTKSGKRLETSWEFTFDRNAKPTDEVATSAEELPARDADAQR